METTVFKPYISIIAYIIRMLTKSLTNHQHYNFILRVSFPKNTWMISNRKNRMVKKMDFRNEGRVE